MVLATVGLLSAVTCFLLSSKGS